MLWNLSKFLFTLFGFLLTLKLLNNYGSIASPSSWCGFRFYFCNVVELFCFINTFYTFGAFIVIQLLFHQMCRMLLYVGCLLIYYII